MNQLSLYTLAGGFDNLLDLCHKWHELCLAHPIASHPFSHGVHPQHSERLAAYLAEALGGPKLYSAGYGTETHVQKIHAGNGVHFELDEICLELFEQATKMTKIPTEPAEKIATYFKKAVEDQRQYPDSPDQVPENLPFNKANN